MSHESSYTSNECARVIDQKGLERERELNANIYRLYIYRDMRLDDEGTRAGESEKITKKATKVAEHGAKIDNMNDFSHHTGDRTCTNGANVMTI